mmetsp:Transcript_151095/g.266715  ORF Transcript_151095/g.266715 Transcript_151095/m.266715 type:complete len:292 (-) Transcript_151095:70-945(-)
MEQERELASVPDRSSGWVGWSGVLEAYPLRSHRGEEAQCLQLSVAPSTACGPLAHLHAGSVWNGAIRLAQLIEGGFLRKRLAGKIVLELGAAAALPSLVLMSSAGLSAEAVLEREVPAGVVLSDYDSPELVKNLEDNVRRNSHVLLEDFRLPPEGHQNTSRLRIVGHTWGESVAGLVDALQSLREQAGFDAILLGDCMWRAEAHADLLKSLHSLLLPGGEVWMAYGHHWPGHEEVDRRFFEAASQLGFVHEEVTAVSRVVMSSIFEGEPQPLFVYRLTMSGKSPDVHGDDS